MSSAQPARRPCAMSVFALETLHIGGIESYSRELSAQLDRHGWDSTLCFDNDAPEDVRRYISAPNVTIARLRNACDLAWPPLRDLTALIRHHRPRILHLHYVGLLSAYPWLAHLYGVERIFLSDHASRSEGHVVRRASFSRRSVTRMVNSPVTRMIAVSDYGQRCLTGLDVLPAGQVVRIHNGIDLTRAHVSEGTAADFRRRFSIPDDRVIVAQVCWMIPEKGVADLLAAAALVVARNPRVHFVLAGDGPARDSFARQARDSGVSAHVTWTGRVMDPFSEGIYAAAAVVCQVSRWEEAFGFSIAEAMASARAVVATRAGGIPELVDDGVTGWLVTRGDHHAMAEKILALVADAALRERMGRAGRWKAEQLFDVQKNVAQLLELWGVGV